MHNQSNTQFQSTSKGAVGSAIVGGGILTGGPYNVFSGMSDTFTLSDRFMQPYINFALIKAHGGTIVQCRVDQNTVCEYYVIPDTVKNFDKELGKIISMQLLKG